MLLEREVARATDLLPRSHGGETSREFGFCIAGARGGCETGSSLGIIHYSTLSDVLSSRRPGTLRPPTAAVLFRSHFATLPSQLHPLGAGATAESYIDRADGETGRTGRGTKIE